MDERIKEHLKLLNRYHLRLKEISKMDKRRFLEDDLLRAAAERYLHLAIESCLNIGNRMISLYQFKMPVKTPETYSDIFVELRALGAIDADFGERLVIMTKFRNRLVHLYWELAPEQIYRIVQENLADFKLFGEKVVAYIKDHPITSSGDHKPD